MTQIKLRRDTSANFTSKNPILGVGEPAYETDTKKLKIGDGTTAYTQLEYFSAGGGGSTNISATLPLKIVDGVISLEVDGQTIQIVDGKLHANLDELGNEVNTLAGRVTAAEADILTKENKITTTGALSLQEKIQTNAVGFTVTSESAMTNNYYQRVPFPESKSSRLGIQDTSFTYPYKSYLAIPYSLGQVIRVPRAYGQLFFGSFDDSGDFIVSVGFNTFYYDTNGFALFGGPVYRAVAGSSEYPPVMPKLNPTQMGYDGNYTYHTPPTEAADSGDLYGLSDYLPENDFSCAFYQISPDTTGAIMIQAFWSMKTGRCSTAVYRDTETSYQYAGRLDAMRNNIQYALWLPNETGTSYNPSKFGLYDWNVSRIPWGNDSGWKAFFKGRGANLYSLTGQSSKNYLELNLGSGLSVVDGKLVNTNPTAYSLPTASSSVVGGIKVGDNLSIAADGTLSATGGGATDAYTKTETDKLLDGKQDMFDPIGALQLKIVTNENIIGYTEANDTITTTTFCSFTGNTGSGPQSQGSTGVNQYSNSTTLDACVSIPINGANNIVKIPTVDETRLSLGYYNEDGVYIPVIASINTTNSSYPFNAQYVYESDFREIQVQSSSSNLYDIKRMSNDVARLYISGSNGASEFSNSPEYASTLGQCTYLQFNTDQNTGLLKYFQFWSVKGNYCYCGTADERLDTGMRKQLNKITHVVIGGAPYKGSVTYNKSDFGIYETDGRVHWSMSALVSALDGKPNILNLFSNSKTRSLIINTTDNLQVTNGELDVGVTVTTQGNTFNGANQLVKLDSSGKLPAIDGSNLTNLPSGGSAPTNMVTTDTEQTISGNKELTGITTISNDIKFTIGKKITTPDGQWLMQLGAGFIGIGTSMKPLQTYDGSNYYLHNKSIIAGNGIKITEPNSSEIEISSTSTAYVTEEFVDGTEGYRVWSNGRCEQWGTIRRNGGQTGAYKYTVTLLKTYKDASYQVYATPIVETTGQDAIGILHNGRTTTQITFGSKSDYSNGILWKAEGYIA